VASLNAKEYKTFEDIKRVGDGVEFWYARELAPVLEYTKWENFHKVIKRAMLACKNSGYSVADCFPEVRKSIVSGKGRKSTVTEYKLTRYACYLIVQNGDPRKEIIAVGQTYFAIPGFCVRRAERIGEPCWASDFKEGTMGNVSEFYEALASDEAMRGRAKALRGVDGTDEQAEAVVAFAKGEGYTFSTEELKDFVASKEPEAMAGAQAAARAKAAGEQVVALSKELSEDELTQVAGGGICGCFIGGAGGFNVRKGDGGANVVNDICECLAHGTGVTYYCPSSGTDNEGAPEGRCGCVLGGGGKDL
jgi:predicted ribosomally synthesized peptide with nif11-like leader